jgi:hypothetical protein
VSVIWPPDVDVRPDALVMVSTAPSGDDRTSIEALVTASTPTLPFSDQLPNVFASAANVR